MVPCLKIIHPGKKWFEALKITIFVFESGTSFRLQYPLNRGCAGQSHLAQTQSLSSVIKSVIVKEDQREWKGSREHALLVAGMLTEWHLREWIYQQLNNICTWIIHLFNLYINLWISRAPAWGFVLLWLVLSLLSAPLRLVYPFLSSVVLLLAVVLLIII